MVRIKHTTHPRVLAEIRPMASDDETEVPSQQTKASPDTSSSQSLDDCSYESRSGGSGDILTESDESGRVKVAASTAAAGMTFDFGLPLWGRCALRRWKTAHAISQRATIRRPVRRWFRSLG
jgi:hypothetical protein